MFRLTTASFGVSFSLLLLSLYPFSAPSYSSAQDAGPRKGATHDVVDEKALRLEADNAAKRNAQVAAQTMPLFDKAPSTESSLMTSSILISDGEKFTILPIGSVLNLPAALRSRVLDKPQGDFLIWPDFLKRNTSWLATKEVTLKMSRGDTKAAEIVMRELSGDNRLVVAVYKGGPITILEPRPSNGSSGGK